MKKFLTYLASTLSVPLFAVDVPLNTLSKLSTVPLAVRSAFLTLAGKGEGQVLPPESEEAQKLVGTSGIGPALIELAERVYVNGAEDDYEHLHNVFSILEQVPVLSEADLEPVRKRLVELWNKEDLPQVVAYKQGGLLLLGNHPSQTSDDVLIKYLDERVGPGMHGMSGVSLISLTKSGGPNALNPLDRYIERCGPESYAGKAAIHAKEAIKKRMAETKPPQK